MTPLTAMALRATLHCLTGCAIGEVLGLVIGTALGLGDRRHDRARHRAGVPVRLRVHRCGLVRGGMGLLAAAGVALAADTVSIAVMEVVDNAVMLLVPGAMDAGLGDALFWGALAFALAVAFVAAVPVNRWLIARGRGHAVAPPRTAPRLTATTPTQPSPSRRSSSSSLPELWHQAGRSTSMSGSSASSSMTAPGAERRAARSMRWIGTGHQVPSASTTRALTA